MKKGTMAMNTFLTIIITFIVLGVLFVVLSTNFIPGMREAVYNMRFGI
jgi:hypothetical protein